jgi:hypothetical protein
MKRTWLKPNREKRYVAMGLLFVTALGSSLPALAAPGGVEDGLQVWLRAGAGIIAGDGADVLVWSDSSNGGNDATFDPANVFDELPPVFDASNPMANDKASVRFNNQNALELDLSGLAGSDYTIFVVNGRDRDGLANFYIAGSEPLADRNLVLGYESTSLLRQSHFNRDLDAPVEAYTGNPVWSLDTFRFSQLDGKDIFHNGELVASDDEVTPLVSNDGTTLGHFRAFGGSYWFQGDLSEVVIYDRALGDEERTLVEMTLALRYALPVHIEEYVDCDADWRNHGEFVSTLARFVEMLVAEGAITEAEGEAIVSDGAQSDCGR